MEEKIIEIFSEVSGYDKELISGETRLSEARINSSAIIQIMVKIEQAFNIEFDDTDFNFLSITTLNDVFTIILIYQNI